MPKYRAPLRDLRFAYYELFDAEILAKLPGFEEANGELVGAVLEEIGKICEQVLQPLNSTGDREGCHFENGAVRTPAGFQDAYRLLREGGWNALSCRPEYGGQGMPQAVSIMVSEMLCASNLAFSMYIGLAHGAYAALDQHATAELKAAFLPKLVEGSWSGTMCLTEPQCGTDLGLVRTKAEPAGDGSYKITGSKIFVSAGEHDLTANIVHLVLARLPDAPAGIKGISLFVIPKLWPSPAPMLAGGSTAGAPEAPASSEYLANGVTCGALEHKMGIKGSPTCVINFDAATGYLVGEPHKGMRAMFTFMNAARLHVGMQGLALADAAYQGAVAFARERLQGRALTGPKNLKQEADPILVHPDVRRMLLSIRAVTEGSRALTAWAALEIDHAESSADPERRQAADDFASLMTPVVKAFQTDLGFEMTNVALQVCGGYGYTQDYGMEQLVRDARITQIYEGTNGIQALDLVGRKLPAHTGRYLRRFFHPVQQFLEAEAATPEMAEFVQPVAKAFERLQRASAWIAQESLKNPDQAGAAAVEYLHLFGYVAFGYLWARTAKVALAKRGGTEADFYDAKLRTARFYMERLLPRSSAVFAALMAGSGTMMEFPDEAF